MQIINFLKEMYRPNSAIVKREGDTYCHAYGEAFLEETKKIMVNGIIMTYSTFELEPLYKDTYKSWDGMHRADFKFFYNNKWYMVEFIFANKNVDKKIELCKKYKVPLITIDMNYFYKNRRMRILRQRGEEVKWIRELDKELRIALSNSDFKKVTLYE